VGYAEHKFDEGGAGGGGTYESGVCGLRGRGDGRDVPLPAWSMIRNFVDGREFRTKR
jgi:hypothetical protein